MLEPLFLLSNMNILVCFKVVPDLDMLTRSDWKIDDHFQVNTSFVKTMINPYDESALELALKLNDKATKCNVNLNLSALTIANNSSERYLKNLYALKYDSAIRIECEIDIRFNPTIVSKIIYQYIRNVNNNQVIILGSQSNVGDNGMTPLLLAERLGIPCITSVINIKLSEIKGCIDVTSTIDDMLIEQTIMPPIVLAIGNAPKSYIRIPTLKDKMLSSKKNIKVYELEKIGIKKEDIEEKNSELIKLVYKKNERSCMFIEGQDSLEKADVLYEDYLRERIKL